MTEEERVNAEANEQERLKKAKDKVHTLIKNARDRKALPSKEEVEGFKLLTGDYVDLFQLMVQDNELPDSDMYKVDTWEDEDFLDRPNVFLRANFPKQGVS